MTSHVLQTIVEPIFKEAGIDFHTHEEDDITEFLLLTHKVRLLGLVHHCRENMLSIWWKEIVQFEANDNYAATLVGKLNFQNPGKFCLDSENRLDYGFDLLLRENPTQDDFKSALRLAAGVVYAHWDAIMAVRYGGLTWEQANRPSRRQKDLSRRNPKVARQIKEAVEIAMKEGM